MISYKYQHDGEWSLCGGKKSSPQPAPTPVAPVTPPSGSTAADNSNDAQRRAAMMGTSGNDATMLTTGQTGTFGSELGGAMPTGAA
jgi:hypothetical protein